jgi:signal transduction histidine kinase
LKATDFPDTVTREAKKAKASLEEAIKKTEELREHGIHRHPIWTSLSVAEILELLHSSCHDGNPDVQIRISSVSSDCKDSMVSIDRRTLEIAFTLLVRDSVLYHPQHRPTISLSGCIMDNRRPPQVLILYEDDGPGIPISQKETIFERGISYSASGMGVGLTYVRDVIQMHGGDIWEDGTAGVRFNILFPVQIK